MKRVIAALRFLAVAGLLATSAALVACGGGGDSGNNDRGSLAGNTNLGSAKPTPAPEEATVKVVDDAFDPPTLTVKVNSKVTWEWAGSNPHSIQQGGGTSTEQTSGTHSIIFNSPGRFSYQCGVHGASMAGVIIVE
jgi:plastocyanin